ncbi:MAG TPA: hypothetical protein VF173_17690 [Thermoanaerobaculia bacterium]|nr:hypothetical protein [Thermoanaerobaculia bacterium]
MKDHRTREIAELLRELPREQARPGFTARVLERLDEPRRIDLRGNFRFALATAAAVLVAFAISAGVLMERGSGARKQREALAARQTLEELRAEHGRLEQELKEISEPPVVYLGGDERVDYVLDLRKVRHAEVVAPAAYRPDTF